MPGRDPAGRAGSRTPRYVPADRAVLRAALVPGAPPAGPDTRPPTDAARLSDLMATFRDDPALSAALEHASRSLAQATARPLPARETERGRLTLALTAYLLRARYRATPFGLFAGSALIQIADHSADFPFSPNGLGSLGHGHCLLLRPPPGWMADLVREVEADPGLPGAAPGVRITAAVAAVRGPRHVVLFSRQTGSPGRWPAIRSVRRTSLLDAVLAVTGGQPQDEAQGEPHPGVRYAALLDLLCAAAPGTDADGLARYLAGLIDSGFLVTNLRPPPGTDDPIGQLADRLGRHPLAAPLRQVREEALRARSAPSAEGVRRIHTRLGAIRELDTCLSADVLLDTDVRLPARVAGDVARAASLAWDCASSPQERPLQALHWAVLREYGIARPVPLTVLLDPARSLGLYVPASPGWSPSPPVPDSRGCRRGPRPFVQTEKGVGRDDLLTDLALAGLAAGRAELRVDDALRRRLAAYCAPGRTPGPLDLVAEVVTPSAEALGRGDYLVTIGQVAGAAGSIAGRLAPFLGPDAGRLARPMPRDAGVRPDRPEYPGEEPVEAELVFHPADAGDSYLVSETAWPPFRIDLTRQGNPRTTRDISLDELDVVATPERLVLRSRRLGAPIRPVSYSALHPSRVGGVAGLLLALGRDGTHPWRAWDWGAAAALPWLPRVRAGRVILAPARWALPPELLHTARAGSQRQWRDAMRRWQEDAEVPDTVHAGVWDKRLTLQLADPVHAALLRRECRTEGVTTVTELPGGLAAWRRADWPRGAGGRHAAEFVISLHPRCAPAPALSPALANPGPPPEPERVYLPGGPWLCAVLTVPGPLQDEVLAELSDPVLAAAGRRADVDRWFFVRVREDAVVIRFHGPAGELNAGFLPVLRDWGERLRGAGLLRDLTLTAYRPELRRYGGADCMAAAEAFFCQDSRLCLAELGQVSGAVAPEQLAAPGAARILVALADVGGSTPSGPRLSRAERLRFGELRQAVRLSGLSGPSGLDDLVPPPACGEPQAERGTARTDWAQALAYYRAMIAAGSEAPEPIAWSLVHMHCNRLLGPAPAAERVAVALACDLLRTRSAR